MDQIVPRPGDEAVAQCSPEFERDVLGKDVRDSDDKVEEAEPELGPGSVIDRDGDADGDGFCFPHQRPETSTTELSAMEALRGLFYFHWSTIE
jgi:hypothetical protein